MVHTLEAVNTGEQVVRVDGEEGQLVAFVSDDQVEIITHNNDIASIKLPRSVWNSFAGKSLKMADLG